MVVTVKWKNNKAHVWFNCSGMFYDLGKQDTSVAIRQIILFLRMFISIDA